MKTADPALVTLLESKRQFACADLFVITQKNNNEIFITNADVPVYYGSETYSCYGVQLSGLRYKITTGLEADEQTLIIASDRITLLDTLPFLDAIQSGSLDGARISRSRAYFEAWAEPTPNGLVPVGVLPLFSGYVASVDAITRTQASLKVKSDLALLDVELPRNKWQASCINQLYDGGCGLARVSWEDAGVVASGSTKLVINWASATPAYYWQGTVLFTSGVNAGFTRTIKNSTGTTLVLSYPLPNTPGTGDTFTCVPGCDKTMTTCEDRFSNLANFKGFPYIPTAETAL